MGDGGHDALRWWPSWWPEVVFSHGSTGALCGCVVTLVTVPTTPSYVPGSMGTTQFSWPPTSACKGGVSLLWLSSSSTKIGCASLSFPSLPTPVGFVFPSVFSRGLGSFILHHEMHSWLCIHGVISVGPVWRVTLHSSPPWQPAFPGLSITLEGWGEGVAWPTLPPHYTEVSLFCGSHPPLELTGGLGG